MSIGDHNGIRIGGEDDQPWHRFQCPECDHPIKTKHADPYQRCKKCKLWVTMIPILDDDAGKER